MSQDIVTIYDGENINQQAYTGQGFIEVFNRPEGWDWTKDGVGFVVSRDRLEVREYSMTAEVPVDQIALQEAKGDMEESLGQGIIFSVVKDYTYPAVTGAYTEQELDTMRYDFYRVTATKRFCLAGELKFLERVLEDKDRINQELSKAFWEVEGERIVERTNHSNLRAIVHNFNSLPWWKRIFKKIEEV